MDPAIVTALATLSASPGSFPSLVLVRDDQGNVVAPRDRVEVEVDETTEALALRPARELFTGQRKAPDLSRGPTPELEPLFVLLEATVVQFCEADGRDETDQEIERIFMALRRRPDEEGGRLRAYLRAAARLYMSLHEVSQAEYEAVMNRLAKSARTFSAQPISRNYVATLRDTFEGMNA